MGEKLLLNMRWWLNKCCTKINCRMVPYLCWFSFLLILPVPEKEKSLNFEKNQGLILFCFLKVVPPATESRFVWHYFSISYIFITMLVPWIRFSQLCTVRHQFVSWVRFLSAKIQLILEFQILSFYLFSKRLTYIHY